MIAAEMQHAGVPWREELHEQILADHLGPRPPLGHRPAKLEALNTELRRLLNSPALNPDSPQELMRALHRNGIEVKSTRQWELKESSHPAIEPLLAYKKLSRLHTANGWAWLDAWVRNGRFQPEYVVGGVVSGRWASRGGGALQIPRQIRGAVHADPGHKLIVADASQLEPRVLVALAQDSTMAEAARDQDLYAGIAAKGFGGDRAKAKMALLGAMYGATSGEAGRLMPQLARTYPRAVGFVEQAARDGRGRARPSPPGWAAAARRRRSDGSAASSPPRRRSSAAPTRSPAPAAGSPATSWCRAPRPTGRPAGWRNYDAGCAPCVPTVRLPGSWSSSCTTKSWSTPRRGRWTSCIRAIEEAANAAKELLFGRIPVEFPVSVAVVDSYDNAK